MCSSTDVDHVSSSLPHGPICCAVELRERLTAAMIAWNDPDWTLNTYGSSSIILPSGMMVMSEHMLLPFDRLHLSMIPLLTPTFKLHALRRPSDKCQRESHRQLLPELLHTMSFRIQHG
ncbi:hypothetical protein DOTSEDRAFT_74475 [Dothistroma septosporum NZE10]|uniref:Uncharacterized protein n=1 Tax=Dothistroma septosporum (strain NZE10 / CBS 128990) TaxID=675120 RepID=N1PFP2_DOTSN|nr:hypothetical protein DOTSEDRAFT_74475 [Dothistroma septosporum NZE10]